MSFFTKLIGKVTTPDAIVPEDIESKRIRNEMQREKAAILRARMQNDLDRMKTENEIEKIENMARLERAKADLAELRERMTEDQGGSEDSMMDRMMMMLMTKAMTAAPTPSPVSPAPPATSPTVPSTNKFKTYTDEELDSYISQIPSPVLAAAKNLDEDRLSEQIISRAPDMDDDSIDRMIAKIRSA